ncbi:MAG TPA: hypothetical protein VGO66_07215 [Solirubrobacterales bacterium]|jgi:hypothetical protein|nr:hypothetical protein [Solirubrobacterales bacterium]
MTRQVIAILTDNLHGSEPVEQILANADQDGVELRVVVPAVEATALRHTMGDIDKPREEAEERLQRALRELQERGIQVSGEVGDPDPVQAAQDALLKQPADEVLIFEHCDEESKWYEEGLLERAQEGIEPPLRVIAVETSDETGGDDHIVDVEETGQGTVNPLEGKEIAAGAYVPGMTRSDFAGIVVGIVGTVIVAVLAAVAASGESNEQGWQAVAILIAIGVALLNLAHVVGLTLFESIGYRGRFARLVHTISLIVTPLAILINAAIVIFAT